MCTYLLKQRIADTVCPILASLYDSDNLLYVIINLFNIILILLQTAVISSLSFEASEKVSPNIQSAVNSYPINIVSAYSQDFCSTIRHFSTSY